MLLNSTNIGIHTLLDHGLAFWRLVLLLRNVVTLYLLSVLLTNGTVGRDAYDGIDHTMKCMCCHCVWLCLCSPAPAPCSAVQPTNFRLLANPRPSKASAQCSATPRGLTTVRVRPRG
jgi:hypothetical protein